MLLDNRGEVSFALLTAEAVSTPALDADGFPVKTATAWSAPRLCSFRSSEYDQTARVGGEPVISSRWRILTEWCEDALCAERLRVGRVELRVIEARPLRAVRKVLFIATPYAHPVEDPDSAGD